MPALRLGLLLLALVLPACGLFGDDEGVRVVDYSGTPITAQDAQLFGPDVTWTARVDTNRDGLPRVALNLRRVGEREDTGEQYEIRLIAGGDRLPAFDAARYERRTATAEGGIADTRRGLRSGRVAIESFDLDGVVSGQTSGDIEFTFYFDFAE
ncbi:MAG: hypothetical protein AAF809_05625 [Bacteroidota bacterium]